MDGRPQMPTRERPTLSAWIALVSLLTLLSSMGTCAFAATPTQDDPLLKAAYIFNFAKFTSWPSGTWHDPDAPLVLCAAGRDPMLPALERLSEEKVGGRHVKIQLNAIETNACQILYIGESEHAREAKWLESVGSQPVLTISENPGFVQSGGMIELFHNRERLRFRINIQAVRASGITLSSRLLGLAEVIGVHNEPPP